MHRGKSVRNSGFSLVELAVVMTIVAFLLGSAMFTLSAQTDNRNFNDTQQRLEQAKELLLAYAVVNRRLPCPAAAPPNAPFSNAGGTGTESPAGGNACTDHYTGFLPGLTIGYAPVDNLGYALDGWGNRIRYAVSNTATGSANNFTVAHNSATTPWSIASTPADLAVCVSWVSTTYPCGTAMPSTANTVIAGNTAVAVIWSQGKNFGARAGGGVANGAAGVDEAANNKHRLPAPTAQSTHGIFVYHPPTPASTGNEFDDQMVWIPVGVLYSRMIAAGILP